MFVRTIAAVALSVAAMTAGSAIAAQSDSFDRLLADTTAATAQANAITAERTERDAARTALSVARSLAAQGDTESATAYLNFARGKLGLGTTGHDDVVGLSASGDVVGRSDAIASHSSYR
ncbi:hypothetical protein [Azospirillum sp. TSO35-2]|uniref:hypothetical protein n=1 Tax=Azospirillum sp. TSO35-2 TaxID=716796 RepID=UPI000D61659A|nr:hypothetical protein [Azospirillum sp. TSO35-2]PWC32726.1 hypothetical protein TSO352_19040 [Azospirillum sp. TSO35-2]